MHFVYFYAGSKRGRRSKNKMNSSAKHRGNFDARCHVETPKPPKTRAIDGYVDHFGGGFITAITAPKSVTTVLPITKFTPTVSPDMKITYSSTLPHNGFAIALPSNVHDPSKSKEQKALQLHKGPLRFKKDNLPGNSLVMIRGPEGVEGMVLKEITRQCYSAFTKVLVYPCSHGFPSESITGYENVLRCHHVRVVPTTLSTEESRQMLQSVILERMTMVIEKAIKFSKQVPGFKRLNLNDQIFILKATTFEIITLFTAISVDTTSQLFPFHGDPHYLVPIEMLSLSPVGEVLKKMWLLGTRIKEMDINTTELSLLCGVVLLSPGKVSYDVSWMCVL